MSKLTTDVLLKESIKTILTELVNSTYDWQEYTDEEIGQIVELDPTQVAELSAVINDSVSAKNKVYSSQYTKELIQQSVIESNQYSDDLVANLSNIKLDIVDSLPNSSTVNKSTIYILKDSTGGTNNTLNVWSDSASAFVEVGKLNVNMDNYYTKSEVDTELAKKANADEVLKPDAIVADLTTTSGSTTLSTAGLQTELDKKVGKSAILSAVSATPSDEKVLSEKATKTELDKKIDKTSILTSYSDTATDEQVFSGSFIKGIIDRLSMGDRVRYFSGDLDTIKVNSVYNVDSSNSQNTPVNHWGFVITMVHVYADTYSTQIFISMQNASGHGVYMRIKDSGTWGTWRKISTTNISDSEGTATMSDGATGNVTYKVINGVCYVSILNLADGLTGNPCCSFEGLPKPSIPYINIGIENNGTRVGTIYSNGGERFLVIKTSGLSGHCSFSYPVAES